MEEFGHRGKNESELRVIEALFLEGFHRHVNAVGIQHHCADNGLFYLGSLWWFMADFGRCHLNRIHDRGFFPCVLCHISIGFLWQI